MLKLKLQCFGQLMRRVDSLEKTLILGGIGDKSRRERPPISVFWPREFHGLDDPWGCKELDMTESTEDEMAGWHH